MNLEKYRTTIGGGKLMQRGETYPILDIFAWLDYATESSAGFSIGSVSGNARATKGHLDIHHPCPGHIKAHLHYSLPEKYLALGVLRDVISQTFVALAIPSDEIYEAVFIPAAVGMALTQYVDRDGRSDRMVTEKGA